MFRRGLIQIAHASVLCHFVFVFSRVRLTVKVIILKRQYFIMDKKEELKDLEIEIHDLKRLLAEKEQRLFELKNDQNENPFCSGLTPDEVTRYSRQIIMPDITIKGQMKLKDSKVLLVGAGGLGCPASLYLAAAGIGNITIIDSDVVELSNLHRQIIHCESNLGIPKVKSAKAALNRLNFNVKVTSLEIHLNSSNVLDILTGFDVVIDGTDNVATRYLLNDACVLKNIPLVSGSALQFEGQLTVYHYKGGPCYRCLFPVPPPPETVTSCGDGGVLGAVPGCIGVLQALETIKILVGLPDVLSGRMLVFDGSNTKFRNITLRQQSSICAICGDKPTVTKPIDYEQFCQANAHDKGEMIRILTSDERVTVKDYDKIVNDKINHILLDVRSTAEFEMCRLPDSINIPFTDIQKNIHSDKMEKLQEKDSNPTVYVLCRRGNDSQRAVKILREQFKDMKFKDIIGGLHAYSAKIDSRFPVY